MRISRRCGGVGTSGLARDGPPCVPVQRGFVGRESEIRARRSNYVLVVSVRPPTGVERRDAPYRPAPGLKEFVILREYRPAIVLPLRGHTSAPTSRHAPVEGIISTERHPARKDKPAHRPIAGTASIVRNDVVLGEDSISPDNQSLAALVDVVYISGVDTHVPAVGTSRGVARTGAVTVVRVDRVG